MERETFWVIHRSYKGYRRRPEMHAVSQSNREKARNFSFVVSFTKAHFCLRTDGHLLVASGKIPPWIQTAFQPTELSPRDILTGLACAGDLSLQSHSPQPNKRPREEDGYSDPPTSYSTSDMPRTIAGTRRVLSKLREQDSSQQQQNVFALPIYSSELGRLPVYGHLNGDGSTRPTFNPEWFADLMSAQVLEPNTFDQNVASTSTHNIDMQTAAAHAAGGSNTDLDPCFYDPFAILSSTLGENGNNTINDRMDGTNIPYNDSYNHYGDTRPFMDNDAMSLWENTPLGTE